ncbi:MAG: hypothetical protein EOM23_00220 [Candidatus Moranbacteria bacterium]|nr:hypothetical protein [Candidatus Moranbacteria bacterium]
MKNYDLSGKLCLLCLSVFFLSGCGTMVKDWQKDRSFAGNIARVSDVPKVPDDVSIEKITSQANLSTEEKADMAIALGSGMAATTSSLAHGASLGMSMVDGLIWSFWMSSPSWQSTSWSIWLPEHEASSKEEAEVKIKKMLEQAMAVTGKEFIEKNKELIPIDISKIQYVNSFGFVSSNGKFINYKPEQRYFTGYRGIIDNGPSVTVCEFSLSSIDYDLNIKLLDMPDEMGGGKAWTSRMETGNFFTAFCTRYPKDRSSKIEFLTKFNALEFYSDLSEKLPKYFYLLIPPRSNIHFSDEKYINVPIVINEGKVYFFAK